MLWQLALCIAAVAALADDASFLVDASTRGNETVAENATVTSSVSCQLTGGDDRSKDVVVCDGRSFTIDRGHVRSGEAEEAKVGSSEWWTFLFSSVLCVSFAALAAGLTMGLMSIDQFDMELLMESDVKDVHDNEPRKELEKQQAYAKKISPVISNRFFAEVFAGLGMSSPVRESIDPTNHHYLLVTLLLVNAAANEALPLFLDNLVPAWAAVLVSIGFVLVFGEIIPSAVFTGPSQMAIAARLCPFVTLIKVVLVPFVWPVSLILDKCLGHQDEEMFSKAGLKAFITLASGKTRLGNDGGRAMLHERGGKADKVLTEDEMHIIHGALELEHKKASEVCEKWETLQAVPSDAVLSEDTMVVMMQMGHSRLMVYKGTPRARALKISMHNDIEKEVDANAKHLKVSTGEKTDLLNGFYKRESVEASIYKHETSKASIVFSNDEWKLSLSGGASDWEYSCKGGLEFAPPGVWSHKSMPDKKIVVSQKKLKSKWEEQDGDALSGYYERESLESSIYKHESSKASMMFEDGEWKLCPSGDVGEWEYSCKGGREYAQPGDWLHKSRPGKKVKVDADTRQILGLVVLKRLIAVNPEEKRELEKTCGAELGQWRRPLVFRPDMSCLEVLNKFQEGKSHMGILSPDPDAVKEAWKTNTDIPKEALPVGFLTLEDVIEELLKEEVFDEGDRKDALLKMGKVWGAVQSKAAVARREVLLRHQRGEPSPKRRYKASPSASPLASPRAPGDAGNLAQPLLASKRSALIQTSASTRKSLVVDRKM